ncbi:glucose-induced degradation complex subunit VID24 Ecym_3474 [Eremothecium cymbalariae DBVPG|uniref:Vacuolar import and degradation protein 24 n=1 Tax=Eremothecium cymbalariae (strain CBS 270.75 / DBVPG 7215 / KCTC 17166 / NRRL Y-17582) TaxID=931890 RepID=G8JS38_ERECY|nr:Hypothetical protein Ecym_3474 [Eremothecium cymbalariae DBVPG\
MINESSVGGLKRTQQEGRDGEWKRKFEIEEEQEYGEDENGCGKCDISMSSGRLFKCVSGESLASSWGYVRGASLGSESPGGRVGEGRYVYGDSAVSLPKKYLEQQQCFVGGASRERAAGMASDVVLRSPITTTNWLKPLMAFQGYQISGYKKYQVHVLLQTVELPAMQHASMSTTPHVTGFLTIRGLTNQHPEITTFFESFAVNGTIGFLSSSIPQELADYKSSDKVDLEHWLNFPSFKELCMKNDSSTMSDIMEGTYTHSDYLSQRYVFMRWKEKFLVPDDEVGNVEGASYDGYYYIVHDQIKGNILGFYYHKDAEKFQQLELTPVYQERQSVCAFEFA